MSRRTKREGTSQLFPFFHSSLSLSLSADYKSSSSRILPPAAMADSKEENHSTGGWMSVPAFGGWDTKNGVPDYSMDFSKIREMRKHSKNPSRASLGNEEELSKVANKEPEPEEERRRRRRSDPDSDLHRPIHHHGSRTRKKKFMKYFQCCIGA